jgi:Rieske Fe-S protein
MNRRKFTKACVVCLGSAALPPVLLSGCRSTHYATGMMESNGLSLLKSEFIYLKKDQQVYRKYIIVRNDALEYPIYLYRFADNDYSAVLMKCTHQGAELNDAGDQLHCPSHGSEFTNKGLVTQGPAETNLRSFRVSTVSEKIYIDLRS